MQAGLKRLSMALDDVDEDIDGDVPEEITDVEERALDDDHDGIEHIERRTIQYGSCGSTKLPPGMREDSAYRWLSFNKRGIGEKALALKHLFKAPTILLYAERSKRDARKYYSNSLHNGVGDAFRHALFSYRVTKKYGSSIAKQFGDAHEVSHVNPLNERLMDLYNNQVGRCLAGIRGNRSKDDVSVIKAAISAGRLQTSLDRSYPGTPACCQYGK
ncbi:uncharacterized protein [Ptychodera flava]|uniref:uncharacterized protein n=1 Tax=Ptychodera flava TaxID=63121 RepID=UPI003969BD3E